ncbi:hypothetical protein A2704_04525 [Candidatus Kaiserbacteria bacterium RIFCSPHIGHO2_01_FULL_54_36b]|uniref:Uncharacterized protein n=1 Tax=Candidatus Kaiserbacteria bacterium RIFCSPHIGHO2_01_FULL_54_36b TaxID=1798483 RepID=A0A1F6CLY3_9BACT|nr:MAG: hypothetical protein A2704_04525 [Candidatus Kaiserbacteria bacterium RIFCSPHIGHO2_01_FULL_54_36b]
MKSLDHPLCPQTRQKKMNLVYVDNARLFHRRSDDEKSAPDAAVTKDREHVSRVVLESVIESEQAGVLGKPGLAADSREYIPRSDKGVFFPEAV